MSPEFRADSLPTKLAWEKTAHGYVAFATLAKLGHPLNYEETGKTRQEYLATFSEDSISSVRGMPICLAHPESVTYQGNKSGVGIGHFLQELLITDSGEFLAPVSVTDQRGIDLIDKCLANGQNPEISPAYWVESVRSDGKGGYEQIRGRYDHAALLLPGQGRGGSSIVLRLDGNNATNESVRFGRDQSIKGVEMSTSLNPTETAVATTTSASIVDTETIATLQKKIDTLTGENAGLTAKLTAMGETHLSLDSITEKIKTLAIIGKINLDSIDFKVSATDLKKQHIASLNPTLDLTGKSDDYISGVFESLTGISAATITGDATAGQNVINSDAASTSAAAIATAKGQLAGTRSDSITTDPIELAKQRRLAQIESAGEPNKKTA